MESRTTTKGVAFQAREIETMALDLGALEYVRDQLTHIEPITIKRMFGGAGFYARGFFFAIFSEDTVYFKTDDSNREDYLAVGSPPFAPWGDEGIQFDYYEVPDQVLDQLPRLASFMQKSIDVAMRAKETRQSKKAKVKSGGAVNSRTTGNSGSLKRPRKSQPVRKQAASGKNLARPRKKARRKTR